MAWFLTSVTASWARQSTWSGVWVMLPWLKGVPAQKQGFGVSHSLNVQHASKESWTKMTPEQVSFQLQKQACKKQMTMFACML